MGHLIRRHIGQILLDGGFLSKRDIVRALEEQKHTKDLLGQVLVRMGVLKPRDVNAPLLLQDHLCSVEDAVRVAAGERQLLGALLVHSGRITSEQLDRAIAEQKLTGDKLGEVFTRLGMLSERQLAALLDFQENQDLEKGATGPLRLGELLVATGYISREQLEDALYKQTVSHKKLGEVLIEEGFVPKSRIKYGVRLQKMLLNSVLAAILSMSLSSTSSATTVALQWDPNTEPDLAGYKVYYATTSASLEEAAPLEVQKQTTATISGLDPDKSYNFAVKAYNSAGMESPFSNIVPVVEQTPPTVAITSPPDSTSVSGTVSVNVTAADNAGVTKVEFYVNGALKATDPGAPYVYTWDTSSLTPGTYTLMVKAYDAADNVSQSSRYVTVVKDVIMPTVVLTSPVNNATVNKTVTINAAASDNVGVSKVEIFSNGLLLFAGNVPPYSFSWDTSTVANGVYSIIAKAYDNAGNINQSSAVTVTVNNQVTDLAAPVVSSFTLPSTSTALTVPVVSLSATDASGVTGYLITENAIVPTASAAGWSASVPASFTFSTAGSRTAYAWAKDAAGNVSTSRSAVVTITLPDIIAPAVTLTSPANNVSASGVVLVTATAADNVGVTKVEFYVNGILAATGAGSKFSYSWDTKTIADGSYTLSVRAYDAAGNVGRSSSNIVTVSNSNPLSLNDALLALQVAAGEITPNAAQKTRLDVAPVVDGKSAPNDKIDTGDAIVIMSKVVGKIVL